MLRRNAGPLFLMSLLFLAGYCLGGRTGVGIVAVIVFLIQLIP